MESGNESAIYDAIVATSKKFGWQVTYGPRYPRDDPGTNMCYAIHSEDVPSWAGVSHFTVECAEYIFAHGNLQEWIELWLGAIQYSKEIGRNR